MFNLGLSELLVIGVIALIFIGPKQLPEVARVVGRMLNEFKRATGDITGSFVKMRDDADQTLRQTKDDLINKVTSESQVLNDVKSSIDDINSGLGEALKPGESPADGSQAAENNHKKKKVKRNDV